MARKWFRVSVKDVDWTIDWHLEQAFRNLVEHRDRQKKRAYPDDYYLIVAKQEYYIAREVAFLVEPGLDGTPCWPSFYVWEKWVNEALAVGEVAKEMPKVGDLFVNAGEQSVEVVCDAGIVKLSPGEKLIQEPAGVKVVAGDGTIRILKGYEHA